MQIDKLEERRRLERKEVKREKAAAFTAGWRVIWSAHQGPMRNPNRVKVSKADKKSSRKLRTFNRLFDNGTFDCFRKDGTCD